MKWTRHRCQVALKTLATDALMPSWESEITSFTPRRPRRARLRRNSVQKTSASKVADRHAEHFATAVAVHADRDDHGNRYDPASAANLDVSGIQPDVRPVALDRPIEECFYADVDFFTKPAHLALRDATHAHGFDQIVD